MKKNNKIDKENQKVVKKIVIAIIIYAIFMTILIVKLLPKQEEEYTKNYIIMDDVYFYEYSEGSMKEISVLDTNYDKYLFDIYSNEEFKGSYYVSDANYEYVRFKRKGSSGLYRPEIPYIALTQGMDKIDFEKETLSYEDVNNLTNLMNSKNVYDVTNIENSYKIVLDLDDDEYDETIYVASNYNYSERPDIAFSIVYVVDEDGITVLEENYVTSENIYDLIQYNVNNILELDNDGLYTIVMSSSDYDETTLTFYTTTGKIYKKINSD